MTRSTVAAPLPTAWTLRLLRRFGRLGLLGYGVRDRVLRAAFHPDTPRDIPFEVEFFGARYRGNFASYIDWCTFFYGAYERYVLAFLRDMARRSGADAVFVDIGANVGVHTLFMAPHVRRVHAFEPYDRVRAPLEDKIARNGVANVTIHPVALGERDEERIFYAPVGANAGVGTFVPSVESDKAALPHPLPLRQGDAYFSECGIDRVDIVKIDAEGFDVPVVKGLRAVIARARPVIVLEIDRHTRSSAGGELATLAGADYRAFALLGPRSRLKVFSEPADRYRLAPFRWEDAGVTEAVLVPAEKVDWLSPVVGGT
jgi:FkbM family methyltransferase